MKGKIIVLIFAFIVFQSFASGFLISDQGTDAKEIATGDLITLANLTISIYDNSTGGALIFEENFSNGIVNGSWNFMINPDLEYGKSYWKDYKINNEDLSFDGNDRLAFQSSVGKVNNISFVNLSFFTDYALKNQSETFVGNITTTQIGFFGWLGSLISRINGLFVQDIEFNGTINGSGNITTTGNVSAAYFIGNGSLLTGVAGTAYSDAWINTTFYNTTQIVEINTSMKNYFLDANSTLMSILNNGSFFNTASTDTFVANYSDFLTHITWANVMNGTLFQTSQWNATNTSYVPYTGANDNLNMGSYNITTENHLIISNGTLTTSHWNMYEDGNGTLVWEKL